MYNFYTKRGKEMYLCKECLSVHRERDLSFEGTEDYTHSDELYKKYGSFEKLYEVSICPKLSCDGMVIEVDELILPAIIELNGKGWITQYCCSGHLYVDSLSIYIKFKYLPLGVPKNFTIEKENKVIRHMLEDTDDSGESKIKQFEHLFKMNKELYEWALSLPTRV